MSILRRFSELTFLDLFSGIGGFRVAAEDYFQEVGFPAHCIGFCEKDKFAVRTYESNFNTQNEIYISKVEEVTLIDDEKIIKMDQSTDQKRLGQIRDRLPPFDILFAGFPCQPFSTMGNKQGFDDLRGNLFFHILAILNAIRPSFFVLENVRGLKAIRNGSILKVILGELKKNYTVFQWLPNSADYGVPQVRRRIFIVGVDKNLFYAKDLTTAPKKVPIRTSRYPTTWHLLERKVDEKYYLSEKIKKTILSNGTGGYFYLSKINQLIARPLCRTMHKMHRASQDNYYSDDFTFGTFDEKTWTVRLAKNGSDRIRRITPLEAFRLQGFSDTFERNAKSAGMSDTRLYMQTGNAVTVPVVKEVLRYIFD